MLYSVRSCIPGVRAGHSPSRVLRRELPNIAVGASEVQPRQAAAALDWRQDLDAGCFQFGSGGLDVVNGEPDHGTGSEVKMVGFVGRDDLDGVAVAQRDTAMPGRS